MQSAESKKSDDALPQVGHIYPSRNGWARLLTAHMKLTQMHMRSTPASNVDMSSSKPGAAAAARTIFVIVFSLLLLNGLAVVPIELRGALEHSIALAGCVALGSVLVGKCGELKNELKLSRGLWWFGAFVGIVWAGVYALLFLRLQGINYFPVPSYATWRQITWFRANWGGLGFVIALTFLSLLPAILEEIVFKFVLFRCWPNPPKRSIFVLSSAVLFTAVHLEQGVLGCAIVFLTYGLPSAYFYYEERSLGALVLLHFVANLAIEPYFHLFKGAL